MEIVSFGFYFAVALSLVPYSISEDNVTFLVIGDWGGRETSPYTTRAEVRTASAMGITAAKISSSFQVSLGDNFYHVGVKNVDDPRFNETFENVFTASSLRSPWLIVLGNHDHYGNASAQIAYSKVSHRWYFPDFYYTKIYPIGDSTYTLQLVFIDTIILAGKTHITRRSLPPPGPTSSSRAEQEWAWIEKILSESTATWLIVVGHYPVWSIGKHGPTKLLVNRLKPMLEKYKANAYFSGHDHCLQHIREAGNPVQYYVIGGGGYTELVKTHYRDVPRGSLGYFSNNRDYSGGYASVTATREQMKVIIYSSSKGIVYENIHTNPRV